MNYPELQRLRALGACSEGYAFALKYDSWQACWDASPRGDWSLWVLGKVATEADRKKLVLVACEGVRLRLSIFEARLPGDTRVRECLDIVEKWARDEGATLDDVRKARKKAEDAYTYAHATYAAHVFDLETSFDLNAAGVADCAHSAASAVFAGLSFPFRQHWPDVAANVSHATYASGRRLRSKIAAIVRKHYPVAPNLSTP